ncbi:hypothetical protein AgCh_012903 [Apium graveolens]
MSCFWNFCRSQSRSRSPVPPGSFLSAALPGLQAKAFSNAISCPSLHFIVACLPSSVLLQFFNEFGIFVMYSCGLMAWGSSNEDSVGRWT